MALVVHAFYFFVGFAIGAWAMESAFKRKIRQEVLRVVNERDRQLLNMLKRDVGEMDAARSGRPC